MDDQSTAVLRTTSGGVAWLTLNRPDKRNALNAELVEELKRQLSIAGEDDQIRVIGIRGAGKDFCSGADLSALRQMATATALENLQDVDAMADLFLLIRRIVKPVVALVHGRALAGGCGLATSCDLVVAAESASFGYPEVRIGFVPAMVMAILRRNVSEKRAFELIVGGDTISASVAERIGLINRVIPDGEFEQGGEEYLNDLASRSASAMQLCKRLLYHQDSLGFEAAVRAGADINVVARMTDDTQAGIARFLGRADQSSAST
jgi:methylglutaconyl-CoA hydratase